MASQEIERWPSFNFPQLASAERTHPNEHQEQPDVLATELGNLETLLAIDDNLARSHATPEIHYDEKGQGRAGHNSTTRLTTDDNSITPQKRTPDNSHYEERGQGRGGHNYSTSLTLDDTLEDTLDDTFMPPNGSPENHYEEIGHNSKAPRDPLLHHIRGTGVEFQDLCYTVVKKQKQDGVWIKREAHLLQGITGAASKGEVTAVLGPSGAGKSTLMDALAGRIASGSLGGTTTVDGRLVTPTLMKRLSSYVMQDDQLFPLLTVWETLWFAAEVRLHRGISRDEKRDRVTNLLDQLGLTTAQNTYIGDEKTRGISGGEKRRVSIGVDIIHGPALLFMDEPTSGLDSGNAFNVIEKVHRIAKAGSTVILTIHQPSFRILRFVNRLIVLARGQLIYQGGPNYLSTHLAGFGRVVPRAENPMEYLLDVIQEYDSSAHGIEPLVLYYNDGTQLNPNDPEFSTSPVRGKRTAVSEFMQREQPPMPERNMTSETILSKIAHPFLHLGKPKTPDYTFEAMEGGYGLYDDTDDGYDHSLDRSPKLASHFYKGLIEGLADRFLTPTWTSPRTGTTPSPRRRSLSALHFRTTGLPPSPRRKSLSTLQLRTTGRPPSPRRKSLSTLAQLRTMGMPPSPRRNSLSALQLRTTPHRTPSTTPHRSPSTTQFPQTPELSDRVMTLETDNPIISKRVSTEATVSEKDYDLPKQIHEEKFANIWWREVLILMFRNVKNFQRAPEHFLSRQITVTLMGFLLATLFIRVRHHLSDLDGVNSIMSFFIFTVTVFFFSSNDAVPAFIMERLIFIRETSHNAYRASSYVIANAIVSIPFIGIQAMTFTVITWWALGFKDSGMEAFFFFFLILFVSLFCASSFVMFVSSVVPNYVLGYMVVVSFTSLYFLMCGFFIQRKQIPTYWIWVHYISTLKYPYEAMMLNEYGNPNHQLCYFRSTNGECSLTGKILLEKLNITQLTKWESLCILFVMAVFYRFLFYCVLRFGTKNQRS